VAFSGKIPTKVTARCYRPAMCQDLCRKAWPERLEVGSSVMPSAARPNQQSATSATGKSGDEDLTACPRHLIFAPAPSSKACLPPFPQSAAAASTGCGGLVAISAGMILNLPLGELEANAHGLAARPQLERFAAGQRHLSGDACGRHHQTPWPGR